MDDLETKYQAEKRALELRLSEEGREQAIQELEQREYEERERGRDGVVA